jgi:hypothetical protein
MGRSLRVRDSFLMGSASCLFIRLDQPSFMDFDPRTRIANALKGIF